MTLLSESLVSAEEVVSGLLKADGSQRRHLLTASLRLEPQVQRAIVERLCVEAQRLLGVDPPAMERLCTDAIALAAAAGDCYLQALARMGLGDALRVRGHNREALAAYDTARAVFLRLERPIEAARTRIGWSESAAMLGDFDGALRAARPALRVFKSHQERSRAAAMSATIAGIYLQQGRFPAAVRGFTAAMALYRLLGEPAQTNMARCRQNRALALSSLGRHRESLKDLELARSTWEAGGETAGSARMHTHIGANQLALGRYSAALQSFDRARALNKAAGITLKEAGLGVDAADCYLALNRPEDALAVLADPVRELQQGGSVQDALGLATRQVAAYLLMGREDSALEALDDVARRFPTGAVQHRAWLAAQRAAVLLREECYAETLTAAREAVQIATIAGTRRVAADALITEANALLALHCVGEAERSALLARRIAHRIDAAPLLSRVLELLGSIAEAQGRQALAIRRFEAACTQLEREQRGVIFEYRSQFATGRSLAYERLVLLYTRAGRPLKVLATAERARCRALAEAIAFGLELRPRGNAGTRRIFSELSRVREDYAAAETSRLLDGRQHADPALQELEARITTLVNRLQIAGAHDDGAGSYIFAADSPPPSLPPGCGLLAYFVSGDEIVRLFVDSTGVHSDLLSGALPVADRLIRALRLNLQSVAGAPAAIQTVLTAQARMLLQRLRQLLLGDLERLGELDALVVVPHGVLHAVPFQALYDGQRYLVEQLTLSCAPSIALYEVCRSRQPPVGGRALVLGNSDGGLLPHAVAEAGSIGSLLSTAVYGEERATRSLLARAGRRAALIHIAAHGVFRADAPLFSCLQLADGRLTTEDVFDLDLRGALVTLSACETGMAIPGGGDEQAGLVRAFLYAGASGLVVSQWRVDDASTERLMLRFYSELRHGAGRATALCAAQRAAIRQETTGAYAAHPFAWAGFQLIGDDQPLHIAIRKGRTTKWP